MNLSQTQRPSGRAEQTSMFQHPLTRQSTGALLESFFSLSDRRTTDLGRCCIPSPMKQTSAASAVSINSSRITGPLSSDSVPSLPSPYVSNFSVQPTPQFDDDAPSPGMLEASNALLELHNTPSPENTSEVDEEEGSSSENTSETDGEWKPFVGKGNKKKQVFVITGDRCRKVSQSAAAPFLRMLANNPNALGSVKSIANQFGLSSAQSSSLPADQSRSVSIGKRKVGALKGISKAVDGLAKRPKNERESSQEVLGKSPKEALGKKHSFEITVLDEARRVFREKLKVNQSTPLSGQEPKWFASLEEYMQAIVSEEGCDQYDGLQMGSKSTKGLRKGLREVHFGCDMEAGTVFCVATGYVDLAANHKANLEDFQLGGTIWDGLVLIPGKDANRRENALNHMHATDSRTYSNAFPWLTTHEGKLIIAAVTSRKVSKDQVVRVKYG